MALRRARCPPPAPDATASAARPGLSLLSLQGQLRQSVEQRKTRQRDRLAARADLAPDNVDGGQRADDHPGGIPRDR